MVSSSVRAAVVLGVLVVAAAGCQRHVAPDIVLVVLDTVRADFTGAEDGATCTPNLDRLAHEGTVFGSAWATAPWTVPSHASIFTGLLPSGHGCTSRHPVLDTASPTLAELLAEKGYETAGFFSNPWLSDNGAHLLRGFRLREEAVQPDFYVGGRRMPDGDQGGRRTVEAMRAWLAGLPERRPFLLFVNLLEAHLPYDPPAAYRSSRLPHLNARAWIPVRWGHRFNAGLIPVDKVRWEAVRGLYRGDVSAADGLLGEVRAVLEQAGRWQDAVVIVASDHGENLGEHGLAEHQLSVHETLLRVPLIVRAPALLPPGVRSDPVMLTDIFATVLQCAEVEHGSVAATSRSLIEASPAGSEPRALVAEYAGPPGNLVEYLQRLNPELDGEALSAAYRTVRVGSLRLTVSDQGSVELHDLDEDPAQSRNIALDRPGAVAALQAILARQPGHGRTSAPGRGGVDDATRSKLNALGYVPE